VAKIVVLGLDGFNPELVEQWSDELPNIIKMQKEGIWGHLKGIVPLTFPQIWTCAQCGQNPGAYGFWDFAYRDEFSYGVSKPVTPEVTRRVDLLSTMLPKMGQRVAIINLPLTWPAPRIPAGYAISGLSTPSLKGAFTHPETLKGEIDTLIGPYISDLTEASVGDTLDREHMLKCIYDMDSQRFILTKYFSNEKNRDYVMTVVRGSDCILNLLYRCFEAKNRRCRPDSSYEDTLHHYYLWVDQQVGELRDSLPKDVVLFVQSGYGAGRLEGRINLNEWLIKEGYMTLFEYPMKLTSLKDTPVDWSKTRCWSTGYTGQLYLNLKGREQQGTVELQNYEALLDELTGKMSELTEQSGKQVDTQMWKGDDLYFGPYRQYGPDLVANFNQGRLGTSELVGHGREKIYSYDRAPHGSDVGHSMYGYFVLAGPGIPNQGELKDVSLLSSAPTVLDVLGVSIPQNMERPSILSQAKKIAGPDSKKDERTVRSRLEALGY